MRSPATRISSRAEIIPVALGPGTRLGAYEILTLLGCGGIGEVYKARDTRLDRTVAIKVLPMELASDADMRARFEREARAVAALRSGFLPTGHCRWRRVETW